MGMTILDLIKEWTTPQRLLLILPGVLIATLAYAMVSLFRSGHLVGQVDSEDLGFQPQGTPAAEAQEWKVFWTLLQPHLRELRQRLTRAAIVLVVCVMISFAFSSQLLDLLTVPIGGIGELEAIEVTEPISVFMRLSLTAGFVLALPVILAQLWLFVAPALRQNEFRYIYFVLPLALVLFLLGALFAYFVMLPTAIPFLVGFMNIPTTPRPANYIKFVTSLTFWVGMSFEMPLIALVLARMGLLTPQTLIRNWRYALVIIAIIAAVITPTVDPINMGLVMAPLIVLYLFSILLARMAYRERQTSKSSG
jgi:sec-independent protein translocase protein TatC